MYKGNTKEMQRKCKGNDGPAKAGKVAGFAGPLPTWLASPGPAGAARLTRGRPGLSMGVKNPSRGEKNSMSRMTPRCQNTTMMDPKMLPTRPKSVFSALQCTLWESVHRPFALVP